MMTNINLRLIMLHISLLLLTSCKYFSSKEDEDKQRRVDSIIKAHKQEKILEVNKDYDFILNSIVYKNSFSKDTAEIVLKEYYKEYVGYAFNNKNNKFEEVKETDYLEDEIHKLEFIKKLVEKFNISEKSVYLIFIEIENYFEKEEIRNNIDEIEYDIWDIKSSLEDIESSKTE